MKVTITYEYDPKFSNHYWARSGEFLRSGETWAEARANLLKLIVDECSGIIIPDDEEVEVCL